jgi:rRNA-processing protein EBP2
VDVSGINDSDSESCSSLESAPSQTHRSPSINAGAVNVEQEAEGEEEEEEQDSDAIPFSDIESLSSTERADVVPHQRLTINNTAALLRALKSIALPISTMPFSEHQTLTAPEPIPIPDINDDLTRELAFYKQCLDAATRGRALLIKEGVPFSRPADYFAEMVKTDEHMGKIRQKMIDEEAGKRAAAEARKQRDLKRFGKQVQVAKQQERDKAKRETLDKINLLKRSKKNPFSHLPLFEKTPSLPPFFSQFFRKTKTYFRYKQEKTTINAETLERRNTDTATANEEELFDVALEGAGDHQSTRSTRFGTGKRNNNNKDAYRNGAGGGDAGPRSKRQKKDGKFGFGGKKRFAKSGDAVSSGDLRGFSTKAMKGQQRKGGGGAQKRLGKSRRAKRA